MIRAGQIVYATGVLGTLKVNYITRDERGYIICHMTHQATGQKVVMPESEVERAR